MYLFRFAVLVWGEMVAYCEAAWAILIWWIAFIAENSNSWWLRLSDTWKGMLVCVDDEWEGLNSFRNWDELPFCDELCFGSDVWVIVSGEWGIVVGDGDAFSILVLLYMVTCGVDLSTMIGMCLLEQRRLAICSWLRWHYSFTKETLWLQLLNLDVSIAGELEACFCGAAQIWASGQPIQKTRLKGLA